MEEHAERKHNDTNTSPAVEAQQNVDAVKKDVRFYLIFLSLCICLFLSAFELTAVSTALPTISNALHTTQFSWIGTAYALSSTAFLPMSGGMAEIFGRRPTLITCVGLFLVGSTICGAAQSMTMMIVGRTIQGLGGGGIQSLSAIILADLVTLEERAIYAGLFGLTWSIASLVGPVIGGVLASSGLWRWLFYINLPICGIAIIISLVFMRLPTPPGTVWDKVSQLDWIGNFLVISSTTSYTIALVWGGIIAPWTSTRVLIPLVLGNFGIILFFIYEIKFAANPLVPFAVISNRTSLSGYCQTFIVGVVALGFGYFLPVYFQACTGASPTTSGILTLGGTALAPAAIFATVMVKRTSRYRPQMWSGWILIILGLGLLLTVTESTRRGIVVGFTVILGVGLGFEYSTVVFPVQAPLPVSLNAPSLAFLMFVRSFASVWGISIGSAVLQNELSHRLLPVLKDLSLQYPEGASIAYATIPSIGLFPEPLKSAVRADFMASLHVLWEVLIAIAAVGALSSTVMKGLKLHNYTDEKWRIQNVEKRIENPIDHEREN